jgi:predicted dehydrogenase
VLSDRFVRVVVIAAPPKDHFSLAAAALKKARHVLFKPPCATTLCALNLLVYAALR